VRGWLFAVVLFAVATPVATPVANADPAAAVAAARAAEALGSKGDFTGAAAKFREAYGLDPLPEYLCNIGVAYHNANDLPRAHFFLGDCVARAKIDPALLRSLEAALATIEGKLRAANFAVLDITVTPATAAVAIDGAESFSGPRAIWVAAGTRTITTTADGYTKDERVVTAIAHDTTKVALELQRPAAPAAKPVPPVKPEPVPEPAPLVVAEPSRPSRGPAIAAAAATGALAITGTIAYVRARGFAGDAGASDLTRPKYDRLVDRAKTWRNISWLLGGLAGAGAVASGYLWYRVATHVEVAPSGASVAITLAW